MIKDLTSSRVQPIKLDRKLGTGLFAMTNLKAGEYIGTFHGPVRKFLRHPEHGTVNYGSIDGGMVLDLFYDDTYLVGMVLEPTGVNIINHNCRFPNCEVFGPHKLSVVTKVAVAAGQELFIDYRTFTLLPVGIQCSCPDVAEGEECTL